jgi:ribonuclease P/MRP protein subunit POP5
MVRLKSRYVLFELLYPDGLTTPTPRPQSKGDDYNDDDDESNPTRATNNNLTSQRLRQPSRVDAKQVLAAVRAELASLLGDYGAGSVASTLQLKYFSRTTSVGIIRVAREKVRLVWAALSYIQRLDNRPVIVRVVRVSGTVKKCEQAAIKRDLELIRAVEGRIAGNTTAKSGLERFLQGNSAGVDSDSEGGIGEE